MDVLEQNVIGATVKESEAGNVSKFLNRILGLAVDRQNLVGAGFDALVGFVNTCTLNTVLPSGRGCVLISHLRCFCGSLSRKHVHYMNISGTPYISTVAQ